MVFCLFNHSIFVLALYVFSFVLSLSWPPHPLTIKLIHCIGRQPLDPTGTHFFCCSHGGEWIAPHDVIQDAFTSIMQGCHNIQMSIKILHICFGC